MYRVGQRASSRGKPKMTKHIHYLKGRSQFMEFFHFNKFESDNIFLPRKVKDEEYVKMPVEFDSEQDNEDIFRILNGGDDKGNPLGSKENQEFIKDSECSHTSMSVGDIVFDDSDDQWFVVMNRGFAQVVWSRVIGE